ncbi:MAG: DUF2284 domain-containing protein [Chloroflexota bacterium]|nr:DUF2284 domain-containing protein [Chloroflexota bacterium]
MSRKVMEKVPEDMLEQDLEKYRQKAIELGATDAKVITTDMIVIDERVRAKCLVPLCSNWGKNANCPPHGLDLDLMRKVVANFKYAIFYMMKVPPEEMAGPEYHKKKLGVRASLKHQEIASKLESQAFYDGYYLAAAFTSGPCNVYLCPDQPCNALAGQGCRHGLRSRPSLEAVGINAYLMATRVGWDMYPIGGSTNPADVPYGSKLGMVLIY